MSDIYSRTKMVLGDAAVESLKNKKVCIFGIGGVGGYVAEALARTGVGSLFLVDFDKVCESNLNRQIFCTEETLGMQKIDAARSRLLSINSKMTVECRNLMFSPDTSGEIDFKQFDYVVDAIDMVSGKLEIITNSIKNGVAVISSMGTGNKIDPTSIKIADIYDTKMCPLARVMRSELRKRGVDRLKVVYSEEQPVKLSLQDCQDGKKVVPGSAVFVPAAAGIAIAAEVVKDLVNNAKQKS
ncbi:MAG: tRNA threonylcarbamoyladenosine dehydratase [bacterium]|nr:tRNA threonylcarbamoyladenosine dehydratase [bacterium]